MEIILLQRIEKLGHIGDVVNVKPGYARNFLLPQNKALRATKTNLDFFQAQKHQIEAENLERKQDAEKIAEKLKGTAVTLIRAASDVGQLYGSVTSKDIVQSLLEEKVQIQRNQINLKSPIKTLGLHHLSLMLHPEVSVEIIVNVARSQEDAQKQLTKPHENETSKKKNVAPKEELEDNNQAQNNQENFNETPES